MGSFEELIAHHVEAAVRRAFAREHIKRTPAYEPTYTSSAGRTVRVRDMPSYYIRNALNRYPGMPRGLRDALEDELAERGEARA